MISSRAKAAGSGIAVFQNHQVSAAKAPPAPRQTMEINPTLIDKAKTMDNSLSTPQTYLRRPY
jgi:hypothetical protein